MRAREGVGNKGASLQAFRGYTKAIKTSKHSHATGGMDNAEELTNNCDKGNPSTIKQRLQRVVPNADNNRLNSVAATRHQASSTSNALKNENKTHERLQAKSAGKGQIAIFIGWLNGWV
jgi:hypothetical protein